jgi:hypothetical protein
MKTRNLVALTVLTVAVVAAAAYSVRTRDEHTAAVQQSQVLFPKLKSEINTVDEISVENHANTITVKRSADGSWVVASKYNYPARFDTVKKVIVGIADMKTAEAKTDDPKLFSELGLADITADNSKAKLVVLKSNGQAVAQVLFGERKYAPGIDTARTYVRKPDGGRAWLVENAPDVEANVKDWMVEDTVAVPPERVKEAELSGPDRPTLTVYRDSKDEKNFKVRNMPSGAKLEYDSAPDGVAGAMAYISYDDVKPVGDVDFSKADTARVTTFDGLQVTASLAKVDKDTWVKFEAVALPGAEQPKVPDASDASAATAAAPSDTADKTASTSGQTASKDADKDKEKAKVVDVPAEAKAINARVQGWAYKIADYKASDLTKRIGDLLAKEKKDSGKANKPASSGT